MAQPFGWFVWFIPFCFIIHLKQTIVNCINIENWIVRCAYWEAHSFCCCCCWCCGFSPTQAFLYWTFECTVPLLSVDSNSNYIYFLPFHFIRSFVKHLNGSLTNGTIFYFHIALLFFKCQRPGCGCLLTIF